MATQAYRRINAVDKNGNPLFSASERASFKDMATNFHKYAVLDYAQENVQKNPAGVAYIYDYMKNNKDDVVNRYGLDDENYKNTLKDIESIMSSQSTSDEIFRRNQSQASVDAVVDDMNIKDGKVTN